MLKTLRLRFRCCLRRAIFAPPAHLCVSAGATVTVSVGAVPEPGTGSLLAAGVLGLFAFLGVRSSRSALPGVGPAGPVKITGASGGGGAGRLPGARAPWGPARRWA